MPNRYKYFIWYSWINYLEAGRYSILQLPSYCNNLSIRLTSNKLLHFGEIFKNVLRARKRASSISWLDCARDETGITNWFRFNRIPGVEYAARTNASVVNQFRVAVTNFARRRGRFWYRRFYYLSNDKSRRERGKKNFPSRAIFGKRDKSTRAFLSRAIRCVTGSRNLIEFSHFPIPLVVVVVVVRGDARANRRRCEFAFQIFSGGIKFRRDATTAGSMRVSGLALVRIFVRSRGHATRISSC